MKLREVISFLKANGFEQVESGKHLKFKNSVNQQILIPHHGKDVSKRILKDLYLILGGK